MKTDQAARRYFISGICCATEENLLRKKLDAVVGEGRYSYRMLTGELIVEPVVADAVITDAVRRSGFGVRAGRHVRETLPFRERHGEALRVAVAALLAGAGMLFEAAVPSSPIARGLLLSSIVTGGWRAFPKGWRALRSGTLDMNVLMTAAVTGAVAIGEWAEGAAVIILFGLSLVLESYSIVRTRKAVESLMDSAPSLTTVIRNGETIAVPSGEVAEGETMIIRPGERIGLDGVVLDGISEVNQASITGESVAARKEPGSEVFAGTLNERGALRVLVTKQFEETLLARMIHLVESAEEKKAPVQLFVERFARIYTPAVFAAAFAAALIPPLLFGEPFGEWFYRALVLLVIACPCALVISTPVTIVSAITSAARRGVLIKGGLQLEQLSRTRAIALDKTGTLTQGRPAVTDVVATGGASREDLLKTAAILEEGSEHPVAEAIVAELARSGLSAGELRATNFESLPGLGVQAQIGVQQYFAGNEALVRQKLGDGVLPEQEIERLVRDGKTVVMVGGPDGLLGLIAVRDTIRPGSTDALERLRKGGIEHISVLSGDRQDAVRAIGDGLNIPRMQGDLMPEEKVREVRALMNRYGTVAMVGDGVNDAPALASASVGIAMGINGADAALESADVVLLSDDLTKLPMMFDLGRRALSVVKQNIAIALVAKAVFLALTIGGYATLWMAILADDGAALAVILNGLRLLTGGADSQS